jgi:hypothetical protein
MHEPSSRGEQHGTVAGPLSDAATRKNWLRPARGHGVRELAGRGRVIDGGVSSVDLSARTAHAAEFVRRQRRVEPDGSPLTDAERVGIEAGARRYTRAMGYRWHGRVTWSGSPRQFARVTTSRTAWLHFARSGLRFRWSRSPLLPRGRRLGRHALGWAVLTAPTISPILLVAPVFLVAWWSWNPAIYPLSILLMGVAYLWCEVVGLENPPVALVG